MEPNEKAIDAIIDALSDARRVAWESELKSGASPESMAMIENLLVISRVAEGNRTVLRRALSEAEIPPTWGHLELRRLIGSGAFGEVYLAWDDTLGCQVALKLFGADISSDLLKRTSVLQEARQMAKLRHENIVRILGAEIHDGRLGYWMDVVQGRSIQEIIAEKGPLPVATVISIGRQMANALLAVHGAGLLHRDISASNVMIGSDGKAYLLDFGSATRLGPKGDAAFHQVAGTLVYLAPETLLDGHSSTRSDIYELGVLLLFMATGRFPVEAESLVEIRKTLRDGNGASPKELGPKLPPGFLRVLDACLARRANDRLQSAADLAEALNRLAANRKQHMLPRLAWIGSVVLTISLAWLVISRGQSSSEPVPMTRTALVFPLTVGDGTDPNHYLGRAIADAVAINLSQSKQIKVLPPPKDTSLAASPPGQIALSAGAGCVITGSVDTLARKLQVSLHLIDARSNHMIWGDQDDCDQAGLSALAERLAREIAEQMGVPRDRQYEYFRYVSGSPAMTNSSALFEAVGATRRHDVPAGLAATKRLLEEFPREPDAHVLRIIALQDAVNLDHSKSSEDAFQQSLTDLEQVDPGHPLVTLLRLQERVNSGEREQSIPQISEILARNDLAPSFRAHVLRVRATAKINKDPASAISDLEEALRMDPTNVYTYNYLVWALDRRGRFKEAVDYARQAVAIESSIVTLETLGQILVNAGQPQEALSVLEQARALAGASPGPINQYWTVGALSHLGRYQEAALAARTFCKTHPEPGNYYLLAVQLQHLHRNAEADAFVSKADSLSGNAPDYYKASYCALRGRKTEAIDMLRSLLKRDGVLDPSIEWDPDLAPLWHDPEFEALVAELPHDQPTEAVARRRGQ